MLWTLTFHHLFIICNIFYFIHIHFFNPVHISDLNIFKIYLEKNLQIFVISIHKSCRKLHLQFNLTASLCQHKSTHMIQVINKHHKVIKNYCILSTYNCNFATQIYGDILSIHVIIWAVIKFQDQCVDENKNGDKYERKRTSDYHAILADSSYMLNKTLRLIESIISKIDILKYY